MTIEFKFFKKKGFSVALGLVIGGGLSLAVIFGSIADSALERCRATVDASNAKAFAKVITNKLNNDAFEKCELPKGVAIKLDEANSLKVLGYKVPKAGLNKGENFYVVNTPSNGVIVTVGSDKPKLSDGGNRATGQVYPSVNNSDYLGYVSSAIE